MLKQTVNGCVDPEEEANGKVRKIGSAASSGSSSATNSDPDAVITATTRALKERLLTKLESAASSRLMQR